MIRLSFCRWLFSVIGVAIIAGSSAAAEHTMEERFAAAVREIVRLEPSALPQLPSQIADWMQAEGYAVPQSFCDSLPHNAVSGNLNEDRTLDWAVLCSRADTSSVAVFWSGSTDSVLMIEPSPDGGWLQTMDGAGAIGYSRMLFIRTPPSLKYRYKEYDLALPDWVVHDAVEDYFCEKGSAVLYWRNGKEERLMGAD